MLHKWHDNDTKEDNIIRDIISSSYDKVWRQETIVVNCID